MPPFNGQRIVVIGSTSSGKSTLAAHLGKLLAMPAIDLDALHWEPGWVEAPDPVFRERVQLAVQPDRWVVAGNYSVARDLIWPRADTVIWLDYAFPIIFFRLFRRTLTRLITREKICNGNVERFRTTFFSRDSLFVWLFQTYGKRRQEYPLLLAEAEHAHLTALRMRSPQETERWIAHVARATRMVYSE